MSTHPHLVFPTLLTLLPTLDFLTVYTKCWKLPISALVQNHFIPLVFKDNNTLQKRSNIEHYCFQVGARIGEMYLKIFIFLISFIHFIYFISLFENNSNLHWHCSKHFTSINSFNPPNNLRLIVLSHL